MPGILRVFVESADGKVRWAAASTPAIPIARQAAPGVVPPAAGPGRREVHLRAEIETKGVRRPVRWACAQPLEAENDGSFAVRLKKHDEPDWRKGV